MRILLVQESDWLEKGPHQSHHLMERLSQKGHEIRVIDFEILWRNKERNEIVSKRKIFENVHKATNNAKIMVIRPPIIKLPLLEYLSLIYSHRKEILQQIELFKPDAIIGFGILNANIALRIAKKKGIPFFYYIIDELHRLVPYKIVRPIALIIEKSNLINAMEIITINEGLRDYIINMGAKRKKTVVIRAGVDLEKFVPDNASRTEIRKKYGFNNNDTVLFFMGWLYDFSGLKEIAIELSNPKWRDSKIKVLVIGTGPLWHTLQKIKESNNLSDRLILEKWMPYEEIPKYILASDICILPAYKNEIMMNIVPIKMYEYMAAGKPVISTRLPGLIKEFGNHNGIIYIDRPEAVFDEVNKMLKNRSIIDNGILARKFVQKNSWKEITLLFENTIETAICKINFSNRENYDS